MTLSAIKHTTTQASGEAPQGLVAAGRRSIATNRPEASIGLIPATYRAPIAEVRDLFEMLRCGK